MKLLQHFLQLPGDRKSQVSSVFQKAHALIGQVKEDDGCTQDPLLPDYLNIDDIGDTYKQKNKDLSADALKSHIAR